MRELLFIICCINLFIASSKGNNDSLIHKLKSSTNFVNNIKEIKEVYKVKPNNELEILLIQNYSYLQQNDSALKYCDEFILASQKKSDNLSLAKLLKLKGNIYYFLHENNNAKTYWIRCLNLCKDDNNYLELKENCTHNLGALLFEEEYNFAEAEKYFLKAISFGKQIDSGSKNTNLNKHYRLLASMYEIQHKIKKADSLFQLIITSYSANKDYSGLSESYVFYARKFMTEKKLDKALTIIDSAYKYAYLSKKQLNIETANSMRAQILAEKKEFKAAYELVNFMYYNGLKNNANELNTKISEAEAKFKVAEIKQQQLLEIEADNQKTQLVVFVAIILFIIITTLVVIFYQKRIIKVKLNNEINTLNKIHQAQENERNRIASDLHDNMGAFTTSMLAQIDTIEITKDNSRVKDLRTDAENIMSTLRETIWILKTNSISTVHFFDLIRIYADKNLAKNKGINVSYTQVDSHSRLLSPTVTLNLYRITQEIIQNIIKHSMAKNVSITIRSNKGIALQIEDDGNGFELGDLTRKSGLENMEFRANEIKFAIEIKSTLNKGTQIRVEEKVENTP